MNLRFLEKKDGKKILQHWNGDWKDIPVEKEISLLDRICSLIFEYERKNKKRPDGVMLGCKEFSELTLESDYLRGKTHGNVTAMIMNVPVYEMRDRISCVALIVEAQ